MLRAALAVICLAACSSPARAQGPEPAPGRGDPARGGAPGPARTTERDLDASPPTGSTTAGSARAGDPGGGRSDAPPVGPAGSDAGAPAVAPDAAAGGSATSDAGRSVGSGLDAGAAEAAGDGGAGSSDAAAEAGSPPPMIIVPSLELDAGPAVARAAAPDAGTAAPAPHPVETEPSDSTGIVIKTILGLAVLLVLAYVGAHPRVKELEEWLGVSQVITAGFPFVALGLIARTPSVGVLTEGVISDITPLLLFGLGWLGFHEGCKFDVRTLDFLPPGTALTIILTTSVPFAVIATASALLMVQLGEPVGDGTFLRDAICLGAAGAMTAPPAIAAMTPRTVRDSMPQLVLGERIAQLDDIAGIVALAFLGAYFRPAGNAFAWHIPPLAWLFVALGLGATVGIVIYAMLRRPLTGSEFLAVVLGSVAFAAGMAGYLRLSPIVVGFVAGTIVGNFPFEQKSALLDVLSRLERPVYLLFLMVAGALWNIGDWRGWLFVPVFVLCRFGGRLIAATAARRAGATKVPELADATSVVAPLSVLAIAVVVSAQSLYQGRAIHWIVTAVISGAIVTEILVQLAVRIFPPRRPAPPRPSGAP